jgi:hypothetical protein
MARQKDKEMYAATEKSSLEQGQLWDELARQMCTMPHVQYRLKEMTSGECKNLFSDPQRLREEYLPELQELFLEWCVRQKSEVGTHTDVERRHRFIVKRGYRPRLRRDPGGPKDLDKVRNKQLFYDTPLMLHCQRLLINGLFVSRARGVGYMSVLLCVCVYVCTCVLCCFCVYMCVTICNCV